MLKAERKWTADNHQEKRCLDCRFHLRGGWVSSLKAIYTFTNSKLRVLLRVLLRLNCLSPYRAGPDNLIYYFSLPLTLGWPILQYHHRQCTILIEFIVHWNLWNIQLHPHIHHFLQAAGKQDTMTASLPFLWKFLLMLWTFGIQRVIFQLQLTFFWLFEEM